MKQFYRCKINNSGRVRYLGRDAEKWIGVDQDEACVFESRLEALRALGDVGGWWARLGQVVLVTVRQRDKTKKDTTDYTR